MSDLCAALGISQIKKLGSFIEKRKKIAARFSKALTGSKETANSVYSRFLVATQRRGPEDVIKLFQKNGIEAKRPVYKPVYMYLGLDEKSFPNAKWAHEHIVSVPIYPEMPEHHVEMTENFLEKNKDELSCWPPA